tara:strand:- start:873 stop:1055 length:183 start_codon:yes stop_codon:yes gene_type:complete
LLHILLIGDLARKLKDESKHVEPKRIDRWTRVRYPPPPPVKFKDNQLQLNFKKEKTVIDI